jgi:hypothetical protein
VVNGELELHPGVDLQRRCYRRELVEREDFEPEPEPEPEPELELEPELVEQGFHLELGVEVVLGFGLEGEGWLLMLN